MTKKTVRGLLDTIGLEPKDWELEPISEHYVPGIGLGATDYAKRWAYDGYTLEANRRFEKAIGISKRKNGRPKKVKSKNTIPFAPFTCGWSCAACLRHSEPSIQIES